MTIKQICRKSCKVMYIISTRPPFRRENALRDYERANRLPVCGSSLWLVSKLLYCSTKHFAMSSPQHTPKHPREKSPRVFRKVGTKRWKNNLSYCAAATIKRSLKSLPSIVPLNVAVIFSSSFAHSMPNSSSKVFP